ncbi:MAG TPA: hypothetical protein VJ995_06080 [Geothermobacteraceae bacterium]|nr:hypothetical protein [Geothermobacteraceae bacterium]
MNLWILVLVAVFVCSGCAKFEEANFVDQEFGQAQMESWDKMIANPDGRYADKDPEGLDGIHAEPAMSVYNKSFSKEPTAAKIIKFGIVGD